MNDQGNAQSGTKRLLAAENPNLVAFRLMTRWARNPSSMTAGPICMGLKAKEVLGKDLDNEVIAKSEALLVKAGIISEGDLAKAILLQRVNRGLICKRDEKGAVIENSKLISFVNPSAKGGLESIEVSHGKEEDPENLPF